jgi:transposase-like protein
MKARSYGPEDKARALAGLLCGERVRVLSRRHGIPEGTVKSWRHRLKTGRMQPEKKGRAGNLLLEHTRALLRSLIVQGGHLSGPARIQEIPAKEFGSPQLLVNQDSPNIGGLSCWNELHTTVFPAYSATGCYRTGTRGRLLRRPRDGRHPPIYGT